ncbi:putative HTH-type transcriptional regulator YobV [Paenibacillus albidus]|uniref:HTH-type transcriptional regulator YobV n=1 Tax=Paenibacillus albidus TaxID=2041023 RepID=A0A917D3Z5_9BACL|nr:YafY family protein [Paenibacillus albidus]GGG10144.1 putative HTH-type transcriptional regulator YobV [Paenibacillus albidus]
MKIDRLLSIVILLLNRRQLQAKELADMFEVSVRTIYRDIDTINAAGIPIVTTQGSGGGIGLMEGYRLDRNILTDRELADIFTALQSVSSYGGKEHNLLMEKISSVIPPSQSAAFRSKTTQFVVDFSPWGLDRLLEERLALLKEALEENRVVAFDYVNADGEASRRSAEPYTLVLKGQAWYLYGRCELRQEFRLFKLLRMKELVKETREFTRQELKVQEMPWSTDWHRNTRTVQTVLHFAPEGKHLAEDHFDTTQLAPDGNGGYTVVINYPEDGWLYGFLLRFGTTVEVLEPEHIRRKLGELAADIAAKYRTNLDEYPQT